MLCCIVSTWLARSSRESSGGLSVRKHEDSRHKTSSHGGEGAGGGHGGDRTHKVTHIVTVYKVTHIVMWTTRGLWLISAIWAYFLKFLAFLLPSCFRPHNAHFRFGFVVALYPFWCRNHFCSLKTGGVKNIFLATNIFPMAPCSVKVSPTVHCNNVQGDTQL